MLLNVLFLACARLVLLKIPGTVLSVIVRASGAVIGVFATVPAKCIVQGIPQRLASIVDCLIYSLINGLVQFLVIFFIYCTVNDALILSPSSSNSLYPIFPPDILFHNACPFIIQKNPSKKKQDSIKYKHAPDPFPQLFSQEKTEKSAFPIEFHT